MAGLVLPQVHPLAYFCILKALESYNPALLSEVSRKLKVSLESTQSVSEAARRLSEVPFKELISLLASQPCYSQVSRLAGELAYSECFRSFVFEGYCSVIRHAVDELKRIFPMLAVEVDSSSAPYLKIKKSPLVVATSAEPTCGFICGFIESAFKMSGMNRVKIIESICRSANPEAKACIFEVFGHGARNY